MGLLVKGQWQDNWYDTTATGGEFIREDSQFRNWVLPQGQTNEAGGNPYPAEPGRYHLFVSLACPWAHRTLIFRAIKKLAKVVSISIVDPKMLENGWVFDQTKADAIVTANHFQYLYQVYTMAREGYSGRVTVPVLWDKQTNTIVNNESAEIIRMLNRSFASFTTDKTDYCPEELRGEIDQMNEFVYQNVNNGVYRCGFATTQTAYEKAYLDLFAALNELDNRLSTRRYLLGSQLTEADWRLFTTLIRFDVVYVGHFKANMKRIVDYPNLFPYMLDLFQHPGVSDTVDFDHIKTHYYFSHQSINPTRIIPKGPEQNLALPHHRDRLGQEP